MTTDWKALCAELLAWAEKTSSHYYKQADVLLRARAALAEPVIPVKQRVFPTPSQAAECGGPCYEGNYCPEACDCGLYQRSREPMTDFSPNVEVVLSSDLFEDDPCLESMSVPTLAILNAYMTGYGWLDSPTKKDCRGLAAALRTAADQLLAAEWEGQIQPDTTHMLGINWSRDALLAIAAELEGDGPAVSDDREPASVTDQLKRQLLGKAKANLIREVIDRALRDTASVHWRVTDTGEQIVRVGDLLRWAEQSATQMEALPE